IFEAMSWPAGGQPPRGSSIGLMRQRCAGLTVAAVLALGSAWAVTAAPRPAPEEGASAALFERALGPTPVFEDLRQLADVIGGRPTGSAALDQAVEWSLARLREAGLENVHAEAYTVPRTWLAGAESASILAPPPSWASTGSAGLRVAALPVSRATPGAGPEGAVVDFGG